jgi:hypothetical protein
MTSPRPSLEERYPTHEAYVDPVRTAANGLKAQRLLLDEDVQIHVQRAEALHRSDAKKGP